MNRKGQNEYKPDVVSRPGETLREMLEMYGMTQADLAARTGRTPKLVNEIIKGKAPITPDTALQFERVFGAPAEFWNNRERHYRQARAVLQEREKLELHPAVEWLSRFPLKQMEKLGWIRNVSTQVEQLRELLNFLGVASPEAWENLLRKETVAYRKSKAFQVDRYALAAWLRKGEIDGQRIQCNSYDARKFRAVLQKVRKLTVKPPSVFQPRIVELCASCGVAVAFVPELPKIRASGAARWLKTDKALIQVNLRYKKDDHFWFTVFHEAGHILLSSKKSVFVDCEKFEGKHEETANRFAAERLIPQPALERFVVSGTHWSKSAIREFARSIGIAPGIVVGQLQHRGKLPYTHCNDLKQTFVWAEAN